jgi:hypothetical protein
MEGYTDIPPAKDLKSKPFIDIHTPKGKVQFIPMEVTRGAGKKKKWSVTLQGICPTEIPPLTPCRVFYKGVEIGGTFTTMENTNDGLWRGRFETVISIPEYWGETG